MGAPVAVYAIGTASGRRVRCAEAGTCVQWKAYLVASSLRLPIWNAWHVEDQRFDLKVRLILRAWQSELHCLQRTGREGGELYPRPIHVVVLKLKNEVWWTKSYTKLHLDSRFVGRLIIYHRGGS